MSYANKANEVYQMINQGQLLEAFDQYYRENVVMQELGEAPRKGKVLNRQYEEAFLGNIQEVHGAAVNSIATNEESAVVMIESWIDVTFKDGNRVKLEQVAVQQWEGEFIVNEKFYHK